jgi:hypothetical protein
MAEERGLPLEEYHRAGHEITNGNPEVYKTLYSRRDDVTLANPFGPPARGWSEVSATLYRAAENYRDGEVMGFENISTVITPDHGERKTVLCCLLSQRREALHRRVTGEDDANRRFFVS